jgi:hypothetical protein
MSNAELENEKPTPAPGMGATLYVGSDCYPCTIVRVTPSGKTLYFQEDDAKRTDDRGVYTESQDYLFLPNPQAELKRADLNSRGQWQHKGRQPLSIGRRRKYRDPSF